MNRFKRYFRIATQLMRFAFEVFRLLDLMSRIGWIEWILSLFRE